MGDVTTHNRVHLVICQTGETAPEMVQRIAETCMVSAYDMRLRLKGDIPRPAFCCRTIEEAEKKADLLRGLGLATIVYVEKDLPPSPTWPAHKAEWSRTQVRFTNRQGEQRTIGTEDVALLVYGRRMQRGSHKAFEYKRPLSTPSGAMVATLDPAADARYHTQRDVDHEHFVIAFLHDPRATPIEFTERGFDYACLGKFRRETNQVNHKVLVNVLDRLFKDAPLDRRLLRGQSDNRGDAYYNRRIADDSSWANATLIYWETLAKKADSRQFPAQRALHP